MGSNPTATANGLLAVAVSNPGFTGDHVGSGGEPGQFDRDMLERDLAVAWMDPMTHPLVLRDKRAPASLIGWAEVLKDHPRDHLPRIGLMEVHAGPAAKWLRLGGGRSHRHWAAIRGLRCRTGTGLGAEDARFELARGCPQHAFQACAIGQLGESSWQ